MIVDFLGLKMWSAFAVVFVWNCINGVMKLSELCEVEVKVEGVVVVVVDDDDVGLFF